MVKFDSFPNSGTEVKKNFSTTSNPERQNKEKFYYFKKKNLSELKC